MKKETFGAEEIYLAPETTNEVLVSNETPLVETVEIKEQPMAKNKKDKSRVGELLELRRENRKVFKMSDGSEQAVFYPETVNVLNKKTGLFEPVDTTLAEEEDGKCLVNRKNNFVAKFSREEENDDLFSIESGMHKVTVSAKKTLKNKNKGVIPSVHKKEKDDDRKIDIVSYSNVESGADYEYSVQGSGVKEEIVVKEKSSIYRYPFVMTCENVTPKLEENGNRVAFLSNETGEEIFFIPAPFMTDANGITSHKVDYAMRKGSNGEIYFSVTADSEWINAEKRAFPVVIDPQIKLTGATDMTTYSWDDGHMMTESSHKIGVVGTTASGYSLATLCDTGTTSGMANAMPISLNTMQNGYISTPGEEVWYEFVTESSGEYTIRAQSGMDTMGYLYDANGVYITSNDDCNGLDFGITATLSGNTLYYVMVRAYGNGTGSYNVVVEHETTSSGGNTSTTPTVQGTLIALNDWQNGAITANQKENWYTFTATAGTGTYIFSTRSTIDTVGYLYDSNNNQICYNDDNNDLNFKITVDLTGGNTYYLKVKSYGDKPGNYSVGVTTENYVPPEQPVCYSPHRMYLSFNMPSLPRNPRIKKAMLKFYQKGAASDGGTQSKIGLYQVTGSINYGNYTPSYDSQLIDFAETKTESYENCEVTAYTFDITTLVDKLSHGETSHRKLMIKAMDESVSYENYVELYGSTSSVNKPEIVIDYESTYGVNTSYRTHTHDLGKFGQGSIDLQCGNLMFESEDFAWAGNRMPVTIKHLYNSALSDYQYTYNSSIKLNTADFSSMKIGYGFKLNVMQSMVYAGNNQYVYIGENGEETYFKESDEKRCDDSGFCYSLYRDVDSGEAVFDPYLRTITQGDEVRTFDGSDRLIKISNAYNTMQIVYDEDFNRITAVIDGAGRDFNFTYNDEFLTAIIAPDDTRITYTYSDNLLNTVTYPDGSKAVITYWSNKPNTVSLLDASGKTVYKVEYEFSLDKVIRVKEYGENEAEGLETFYSYSAASGKTSVETNELEESEEYGDCYVNTTTTVYTFNDDGEIVSEYVYSKDTGNVGVNGEESGIHPHSGDGGAKVVSNINNLLLNHNFNQFKNDLNQFNNWYGLSSNCDDFLITQYVNEQNAKFGKKVLSMVSTTEDSTENGVFQVTNTLPAGQYTFSAYLRVFSSLIGENSGAYIRVTKTNDEVLAESEHIVTAEDDFIRLVAPFELTSPQSVQVQIIVRGSGKVYADAVQLENNAFANAYNMLVDGNFELGDGWETSDAAHTTAARFNMQHSLSIAGVLDETRRAWQQVDVKSSRSTRETFTLSGWAKGYGLPTHESGTTPTFRLRAVIQYGDSVYNEPNTEEYVADFSPCTEEWQLASIEFAKSKYRIVDYITVYLDYDYNFCTVYFDDIQLVRNSIETDLSSDDFETEPEEQTATDNAGTEEQVETESETAEDTGFKEKIDEYGNALTETTFTDGEFGTIYRSFKFNVDDQCCPGDNAGNDLVEETDARGNTTKYTVNPDNSRNEEVIDRCGNKTAYEYDASGKTVKVTSLKPKLDEHGNKVTDEHGEVVYEEIANVSYAYDSFDNMTEIARGDGMKYQLKYNAFHNLESIGIEDKEDGDLIKYTYKNGNGRLKEMAYANGDKMKATYNSIGQMIAEKWYDYRDQLTAHYKYVYDGQGNIVRSIDILGKKEYNYLYEDGKIMQSTESNITVDAATDIVTSKSFVCSVRYYYNAEGALTKKYIKFADGTHRTVTCEQAENESQIVRFDVGGKTITSHSKTDSFGRKMFDELQLGKGFVSRQFHYLEGKATDVYTEDDGMLKSTPTTQLVSQIVLSGGRTIAYEYDAEERITKVTDSVDGITEYTYDALGQLLTETKNGTVVNTMTYDNYGNIASKNGKVYSYELPPYYTPAFKDQLIGFDEEPWYGYDAQGNPISDMKNTYIWEKGRQLKEVRNFEDFPTYYTYNANGIRTSKTIHTFDSIVRHDYVLDGAKILRETWNYDETTKTYKDILVPLYDNEDSVCGIEYNGSAYYFLKNLQGDVIAITDNTGEEVARYSYDAWGVCTVTMDNSGCDIANINPFRYRSYYFDKETGLYYLQSRYYDPEIGRFINADEPMLLGASGNVTSYNLFSYCGNDVINKSDKNGYLSITLSNYRSVSWLAKFMSKSVKVVTEREKTIAQKNIRWLGIKIAMSAIAGTSANTIGFFTLKKSGKNVSCSVGGISFSSNGTLGLSASLSLFSTSVKSFVNLSRSSLTFGMSVFHNIKQNGKKLYFGVKLAISISYLTLAAMAFIGIVSSIFVPVLAPVVSKIASSVAGFVSNPYGLAAGTSAVVTVMRAVA